LISVSSIQEGGRHQVLLNKAIASQEQIEAKSTLILPNQEMGESFFTTVKWGFPG
jgi:hypothetical protein